MVETTYFSKTMAQASIFFSAGIIATRLLLEPVTGIIQSAGFLRTNFRGDKIPAGVGVVFLLGSLSALTALIFFFRDIFNIQSLTFIFAITFYSLVGIIDDFWGDGSCRGLTGHLKSFFRGCPTTGSLKAAAGGLAAIYISAVVAGSSGNWLELPINTLLLAFSVNLINLMDLRPGRAGKSFLAAGILIIAAFPDRQEIVFCALVLGCLLAYMPNDLKARAMMGDVGSNSLGSVLGLMSVWVFTIELKIIYLGIIVFIHVLAERHSLTRIIASNRILNFLDRLGRQ